ncbi:ion transporter [Acuticoccus sp. M5D2P5]|uniref:ion transporter n=1 Tax=Acuticoccus kalidii TaxID=2910977 RepID=UPI001F326AF9|nr:ion transporter [Acuticoccus kalidii]MCF3933468.1 ion transporter [Acuticoccus kalidii]
MRDTVRQIISSRRWEHAITALIVINAITLGLETSDTMMERAGSFLYALDRAVLVIFVVEIALRLYVHRLSFFRDPWSLFDFTIVGIALMPATGPFQVLRALRILRVLRLLSMVPSLRRVVTGLVTALPGMGSIIVLLVIVFYVASVMATELFGSEFPEWFGTIGLSAYTLFQIMTLESWSMGIARPVMEAIPNAWIFFVPFVLLTAFVVLNLFIGVVVSAMQETVEAEGAEGREAIHDESVEIARSIREMRAEIRELRTAVERRMVESER